MKTNIDPTPAASRAALVILEGPNAPLIHLDEVARAIDQETGLPELLDAAKALSASYLDAEPTRAKADAWLRLRAAIRAAS